MLDKIKIEVIDLTDDSEEINVKIEDLTPVKENHIVSDSDPGESSGRFIRNREKSIEKAVEEIRKGQSLVCVSSHYGIPQEVLYNKLISRSLPREDEILTNAEEDSLIKWILKANKNNTLVFKQQLMEKVGKLKKVMNISIFFAKSKFGRKWYDYFMKTHPEIYENDGLIMPVDKVLVCSSLQGDMKKKQGPQTPDLEDLLTPDEEQTLIDWIITSNKKNVLVFKYQLMKRVYRLSKVAKSIPGFAKSKFGKMWFEKFCKTHPEVYENDELLLPSENVLNPSSVLMSHGLKDAVVVLHDFRKDENTSFILVRKDTYVQKGNESREEDQNQEDDYFFSTSNKFSHDYCEVKPTLEIVDTIQDESVSDESGIESDNFSSETSQDNSYKSCTNVKKRKKRSKLPGETPICHLCVKSFCNSAKLKRHMLSIHQPHNHQQFVCFNCKKSFPSKIHLQVHMKNTHMRPTFFYCEKCGKAFKHRTSVRKHQRTIHEGLDGSSVNFYCDICKKGFRYKNSLEAHIIYGHLKVKKKFSCDICNKTFIKNSLMLRHRTRHSKVKPMECMHCGKTYPRKYILREHIKNCPKFKRLKKDNGDER